MRKFNIELTEEQMWLIANCMEDIGRFASGQMELRNTLPKVIEEDENFFDTKDLVENKLYELKKLIFPKLQYNESLGYNSNSFIGNTYQIYRTIKYHLLKDRVDWVNVYSSPALPSGDMGTIKITEIKE